MELRDRDTELPKETGVSFSTVSRWLNGKTKPNKMQQYHIEKFLKGKAGGKKKI